MSHTGSLAVAFEGDGTGAHIATGLASNASAYNVPFEGTIAGRTCRDMLKIESSVAEFYDSYCDVCLRSPG